MIISAKNIFGIVLLLAVVLLFSHLPAYGQSQSDQSSNVKQEIPLALPDLTEFIPLASELSVRFADLKKRLGEGVDVAAAEEKYAEIAEDLKKFSGQLQRLKESPDYKYNMLLDLRESIKETGKSFDDIGTPINEETLRLRAWRNEWRAEKEHWSEWKSSLRKEGTFGQLKTTFAKANKTIDTALDLLRLRLEAILKLQEKAGDLQSSLNALLAELDGLIKEERRGTLLDESPPMFSSQYFAQFKSSELWQAVMKSPVHIIWPDSRFFEQRGWIVLLQVIISLFMITGILRNRRLFIESELWRFLAERPFSAGLFLGYMTTVVLYEYWGAPATWKLANTIVAALSFARLISNVIEVSWKRHFVYGLVAVLIATRLMEVLNVPLPLLRFYIFLTALAGMLFCLRMAGKIINSEESRLYSWSLRLGSLFFAVIMIAELWGRGALASFLFVSLIDSITTTLVFLLFMYMIRGWVEWLFRASPLRRAGVLRSDADTDVIIRQVAQLIDILIYGLILLPALLMIWGVYDSLEGAITGLLALGFNLGSQRISIGLVIGAAGIMYGAFLISWILQKLIMDEVLFKSRVERGVRLSIGRLVHYAIVLIGFLVALSTIGFEVTKITIMLSALGVGIGFGLQGVVNNFVSGLILLFERPVRVGDIVEIGGNWAEIKRIGLRATTVQTYDQADMIIPNADLVSNQVTNWTLSNRQARLIIPVGVNAMVFSAPPPQVLFLSFGESSLDFELRVWVVADDRLQVKSALNQEIDRSFREANIEIAFPQRDLHVRSVDESIALRPPETDR